MDSTLYDSGDYIKDVLGIRIRQRGNTSALWNKKPYKLKLSKKFDLLFRNNKEYKNKDWVLLRNGHELNTSIGYKVSEIIEQEYTPQSSFVNVVINGDYKGIYILSQSIEISSERIDLSDTGFILEDDAYFWNEDYFFKGNILPSHMGYTIKDPDVEDLTTEQLEAIENYIKNVENALETGNNIDEYIDYHSFAGWLLGHDILGTIDAAGSNRYLTKYEHIEGNYTSCLLKMGTLWDFDDIFKRKGDWAQQHNGNYRFYYKYLLDNTAFKEEYAKYWENVKNSLNDNISKFLYTIKDSIGEDIDISRKLDDQRWGRTTGKLLDDEIATIEQWFDERTVWLNENIKAMLASINDIYDNTPKDYDIYMLDGRLIIQKATQEQFLQLPKGIYIVNGEKVFKK